MIRKLKPFNKMTIREAMIAISDMKHDYQTLARKIELIKKSGTYTRGVYLDSEEKAEEVRKFYREMDKLSKNVSSLTTARNHTNDQVKVEIDNTTMSLNQANSELARFRRDTERYGLYETGNGFERDFYVRQDYYKRLEAVVNEANASINLILP